MEAEDVTVSVTPPELSAEALEGFHQLDRSVLLVGCNICRVPVPITEAEAHEAWHERIEGIRPMTLVELRERQQRVDRCRRRKASE